MATRAAIAFLLGALAWTASARAEDDPACARYHDALSYNLCLASHGPKANNIGRHPTQSGPRGAAHGWAGDASRTRASAGFHRWPGAHPARRVHGRARCRVAWVTANGGGRSAGVAFEHKATDAVFALYELIVTLGYE